MATEAQVDALTEQIVEKQRQHNEAGGSLSRDELRALADDVGRMQSERERLIREGCRPCKKCGCRPTGLVQSLAWFDGQTIAGYGVKCSRPECPVRAASDTLESMRFMWDMMPLGLNEPDGGRPTGWE
jgi:hypothetical protein